jgi:outer membrane usher protein
LYQAHDPASLAARWLRGGRIIFLALLVAPRLAIATETATEVAASSANPAASSASSDAASANAAESSSDAVAEEAPDADGNERLFLDVQINGRSVGKIGEFTLHYGKLMARPQELRDLGFRVPASLIPGPDGLIAMAALPGLTWTIDPRNQVLRVTAADSALAPTILVPYAIERMTGPRVIESGKGITLNDDISGTFTNGQAASAGGLLSAQAFTAKGVLSSGWLAYVGGPSRGSGQVAAIRLDSDYSYADVNSLRRYTLGDFITSSLSWTRPVHLEGAQIRSDFTTRPDLVTFPLPGISGSAAVPSTVNVLVDGNLVTSNQIDGGPFEIPQLPVVSGAGTITMTVTNALGQQVSVSQPFYASSALLKPGLQTYAAETGLVRREWGAVSDDYGKIAGTAVYRRGLTRKFTFEGSLEGTPGTMMGGAGGVLQVGSIGVLNFAAAASAGSGGSGTQFSVGAQRIGKYFSLGGSAIVSSANCEDIAARNGTPIPRKQMSVNSGVASRRFGTLGAAYAALDVDNSPNPIVAQSTTAQHSKVFSANYTRQIHRVSIYATEFRNLTGSESSGIQVGMTIPLGRRSSASAGGSSDGIGQVQVQQSATKIGEWGYEGFVSAGNSTHEFGQVQYKSPVGLFTAGVDQSGGVTSVRLESQGALSFVDKHLFLSNYIYDSFAIVDTSPVPHVHVYQENREIGRTNSSGRLLVPDMRSFDLNLIAIEPTDIPADATIDNDKREVRPQALSGVVLKFPIHFNHAALLQLVDQAGVALPLGSAATLRATGAIVPIGYDGDAYVEDLSSHNELIVVRPNGHKCTVVFNYEPLAGDIPSIGPLTCTEKKP